MIMKLFKHPDNIKDIRIVRDREGNCKGFCYVDFQEADQATAGSAIYLYRMPNLQRRTFARDINASEPTTQAIRLEMHDFPMRSSCNS